MAQVGYSLVSTAGHAPRGPASTAALYIPAPPAPTITTSYRCWQINAAADDNAVGHPSREATGGPPAIGWVPPACGERWRDHVLSGAFQEMFGSNVTIT